MAPVTEENPVNDVPARDNVDSVISTSDHSNSKNRDNLVTGLNVDEENTKTADNSFDGNEYDNTEISKCNFRSPFKEKNNVDSDESVFEKANLKSNESDTVISKNDSTVNSQDSTFESGELKSDTLSDEKEVSNQNVKSTEKKDNTLSAQQVVDEDESDKKNSTNSVSIEHSSITSADIETTPLLGNLENSPTAVELEHESPSKESMSTSDYFSTTEPLAYNEDSMMSADFCLFTDKDSNLPDLPKEIIEEERKFALQTELEFKKNSNSSATLNNEERQKRYKILMSLLGKSKEYANYMSQRLTSNKEAVTELDEHEPEVLQNATNRPGPSRKRKNSSRENSTSSKKAKIELPQSSYNTNTHYKNDMNLIVSHRQPRLLVGGIMRDYQLDGLEWMVALYKNGVNGILADEMGLGKTIQVISLLCHLREKRVYGPHLIIGPLSTLPNWLLEFANFAPDIPVALFHGSEEKRNQVVERFVSAMASKNRPELPVIVTSYEMPLRDKNFLSAVKWGSIIVDEGHRLKNYQSMLSRELKRYKTDYRLLLTGTPLQNNIKELWSLLNYLIPEIFDDLAMFEDLFDFSDLTSSEKQRELIQKEKEEQLISKMHQILEPFLLRRVKADVDIWLPPKKEILVKAPLTAEQEELYKCVLDRSIGYFPSAAEENMEEGLVGKRKKRMCTFNKSYSEDWGIDEETDYLPTLLALPTSKPKKRVRNTKGDIEYVFNIKLTSPFMMLRKIVNHPYLVKTPVIPGTRDIIVDENLIQQSGKLLVLDALLPKLKADGHKILLFSAFKIMLNLVEDYVIMRNYKYVRLDGDTNIDLRLEYIKQYNSDPETFIFLITTRAGGLGINLTAADTVIIYDSDWNPQVDLQAQDRCHRIGQTRPVVVYRLVTAGTMDEHILNIAVNKRRLEKLVVKKGKFKQTANEEQFTLAELKEVMESNDYKQVIHPNGLVLSDEEIERLLDRSDLLKEDTTQAIADTSKADDKKLQKIVKSPKTPRRKSENQP